MIDVIMPVWIKNEELVELTKQATNSLGECNLIIIDNGSPLGGGFLRERADIYIRNRFNLGYAKAVNQGLRLSKNKLKAIANNDIRVSPNWQSVAEEVFLNDKAYSCHFRMVPYDEPFSYGQDTWYEGKERWCSSSFFVIRTNKPFLYDENYINSYDDWDMWRTVRYSGWKTAYTNKASYQHNDSYTQKLLPEREVNNQHNRDYFREKWGFFPEQVFEQEYPDQMKQDWRPFP